jgi:hypothetical protein
VQSRRVHEVIVCHCSPILVYDRYQTAHMASLTAHSSETLIHIFMRYRILRVGQEISSLIWILKFRSYYKCLHWLLFCARHIHCTPSDTPLVSSNNILLLTPWILGYQGAKWRSSRGLSTIILCQLI